LALAEKKVFVKRRATDLDGTVKPRLFAKKGGGLRWTGGGEPRPPSGLEEGSQLYSGKVPERTAKKAFKKNKRVHYVWLTEKKGFRGRKTGGKPGIVSGGRPTREGKKVVQRVADSGRKSN